MKAILTTLFFVSTLAASVLAEAPRPKASQEKKTVRLLTIGNSFSRNATRYLPDLVRSGGHALIHDSIVVGGASLELHATMVKKHEANPQDRAGLYKDGRSLKQHLKAEKWDVVTLQQASIRSHNIDTFRPYARELYDYIKTHAPQAKVMIHETWAYRSDDPRFSPKNTKPGEPLTQKAMYEGLRQTYQATADELGVGLIPTGDAFYLADTDADWGYQADVSFNPKTARHPALPRQTHSLHTGWQWKKNKQGRMALNMDGHHANLAGEYLGACVFYATLFDDDVTALAFKPASLKSEYAAFLRQTARRAVKQKQPAP